MQTKLFTWMFILLTFLLGMYFCLNYENAMIETYQNQKVDNQGLPYSCPNILIQKGKEFLLKNTKLAEIPGVNPLRFKSLEEYTEFMEWQRSQGIRCPVLFLQHTYDAQGQNVYRMHPSPHDLQPGLPVYIPTNNMPDDVDNYGVTTQKNLPFPYQLPPKQLLLDATRDNPPYNNKQYPGFDPDNLYIGVDTPLDALNNIEKYKPVSANAMDTNWGGVAYSQRVAAKNKYQYT